MISLIKNELKKILSKKSLYIVLIITIGFCILANIMSKKFSTMIYMQNNIVEGLSIYEEDLENAKANNDTEGIIIAETKIEAIEILNQYSANSWQVQYSTQLEDSIYKLKQARSEDEKKKYQEEYDNIIKNFKENNWKACAEKELEKINKEIELSEDSEEKLNLEDEKQVLNWRIEKDIPYGNSNLNSYLDNWKSAKALVRQFEKETNPSNSYKIDNEENIATIAICEYAIENRIDANISKGGNSQLTYSLSENAKSQLLDVFDSYGIFIIIAIVITAGTIVSEEFNKGTIKLLLVRPYKRTKILLAKFLTCLITLLISLISLVLIQTIVGGLVFGFESYSDPTVVYNFNTNSLETVGLVQYLVISALSILPQFILLMTLSFAIGTIITNTPVAIALPFLGLIGEEIINSLVFYTNKAKFLIYFVTPNWDLSIYEFGKTSPIPELSLPFSICICVIYFSILLGASIFFFRKKDIKNI